MQQFEYRVVPAPRRGEKARGVKTTEERFALALTTAMNEMAAEGWEYVRADALPCDERAGLTGTKTTVQNLLVFRRALRRGGDVWPEVDEEMDEPVLRAPVVTARVEAPAARLGATATAPEGAAPALGPARD
ncbi:DUF4177 domain-containing protein [Pseudogemmobacter blasticus]|uniref:DUF4177 domain-containing protein n=1 Tax=Fuscovulum blasticum DSM 2131 TaxID=1188250 RepID=A0A2T4J5N7_FUSBL|nr:DUF4177 domain-containing protein [Fuscovulum blasticum]AWD20911.1 hypothetical protein B6K69_03870 [Fuscovulum blasticum]PTE13187.1 DUF4177 domain-containing protein [Fuscovulum blasticum DSM 2131]